MTDPVQKAPPAKPKAGGKFFALVDEIAASERRLDAVAEPLLAEMAETERLATQAVEARRAQNKAAQDYIKKMRSATDELSDGNGGPPLDGLPPPVSDLKQS